MGRPREFEADSVVEQAMETFWTHGYANTSPALLAEATGIGKGSLYNTFGSKRQLFDLALAHYEQMGVRLVTQILSQPGTTRERLRAWLRFAVDADLEGSVRRGCMVTNTAVELAGHDEQATAAVRAGLERITAAVADRIEQGRRDGDVRADIDARAYADFMSNTLAGLRITAKTADAAMLYRIIDTALSTL
ncbi:TetR/AcrR family transcriptional regulator [Nocardia sp. NBC_01503]|uniref:TetR/AcrR family transcriptional regulator n=1 Tax=Nocardia sp. NBC_01503 TaxID=2975997 RepID=UPI002E7B0ABD|nr:TetR/AcrR family transcriptional regulator [Nocardia sp. NBC_01503]WTL33683.1 TetR/AcrR family transcriptional regulator [Nocardia sp. NBC_01503]